MNAHCGQATVRGIACQSKSEQQPSLHIKKCFYKLLFLERLVLNAGIINAYACNDAIYLCIVKKLCSDWRAWQEEPKYKAWCRISIWEAKQQAVQDFTPQKSDSTPEL